MSGVERLDVVFGNNGSGVYNGTTTINVGGFDGIREGEIRGRDGGLAQVFHFNVNDLAAEKVEVKVVTIVTEGLFCVAC